MNNSNRRAKGRRDHEHVKRVTQGTVPVPEQGHGGTIPPNEAIAPLDPAALIFDDTHELAGEPQPEEPEVPFSMQDASDAPPQQETSTDPQDGTRPVSNGSHPNGTRHITQRVATPPNALTPLLETLRALFSEDRGNGVHADAMRCGICYLTYHREFLRYHEAEGFYACQACEVALGTAQVHMVHRQRK